MDGYTSYIPPEGTGAGRPPQCAEEEVKLIKDIAKPDKVSVRNVDKIISDVSAAKMILRKGYHEKEKIPFTSVSEYLHAQGLDIIELKSADGRSAFIRIKSRESMDKWLEYLTKFLPYSENEYELPDAHRGRSLTNVVHNRERPRRTPRTFGGVQSVVDMVPTAFPQPLSTQNVLDTLHDDEDYDVVMYSNISQPFQTTNETYSSLRSNEDDSVTNGFYDDTQVTYQENDVESQTVINVNVIRNKHQRDGPPVPPKRGSSRMGYAPHMSELTGVLQQRKNSSKPRPPLRQNIRQADSEFVDVRPGREPDCRNEEGGNEGLYVVRCPSDRSSDGSGLTTFRPEVTRRNHTVLRREDVGRRREATLMEDSSSSTQSSPRSAKDVENSTPANKTFSREIYEHNARLTVKCEMDEPSIICQAELGQLQQLGIVTTQYGACINHVPANLHRKFYHGDKITSINEQRIADADFARSIISTSECKMVRVTVRRFFKGHYIELERETVEDSEALGFALHNGSEIMYISPGTMFAKQATGDMMSEKLCITHIEKNFIPPDTSTEEVNVALRNAGYKFHIILQPVEFMKELMQKS